jgi:hypothetical protein
MALIKPWVQFKFGGGESYTPAALSRFSEVDIEKEYTRLRRVALGRLKTIGKSEFRKGDIYKEYKNRFDMTAKQIVKEGGTSLLKYRLSAIQRFLSKKAASVTGLREIRDKTLGTLHEHNYDFITAKTHGFDYNKRRWYYTDITPDELLYCINDVRGLVQAMKIQMERDGDDLYTIPLTNTGYVRRDVKKAMKSYGYNRIQKLLPDYETYKLLRQAFRGGNTHAKNWNS